jgi:NAD(P)-dependent dehydrogenase (short-subunit alcohol dehydrogenase family)
MSGKTCLITGATAGIGLVTAKELARMGSAVTIVGRNQAKCAATVAAIREETQNQSLDYLVADLSSQSEVRQLADMVKERHKKLDVLVNNAGAINFFRNQTVDGIESTFAVNHLAYFMLTNLLLDLLTASAPARVVNVSSDSHRQARKMNVDDLPGPNRYFGHRAYARSKLCNVLFTYELERRLEGTGLTANALHPGLVSTNIMANNGLLGKISNFVLGFRGTSVEQGAKTPIYLASSPEVEGVTGKYFVKNAVVPSSEASYDEAAAGSLWELSARLTGIPDSVPTPPSCVG